MFKKLLLSLMLVGLISISVAQTQYTLTTATDPNGLTLPTGAGVYDENTYAPIVAATPNYMIIPDAYIYIFSGWDAGVEDPDMISTTILMDADKTATAYYQKMEEILTAKSQGYWKNKDGLFELTLNDAVILNAYTPWLAYFNTTDLDVFKGQVKTYLTPKAKDSMQKKLGQQLLAAYLSYMHGYLDTTRDVWYDADMDGVFDSGEAFNIGDVMDDGLAAWSSGVDQAYYKDLLDWINSNHLLYIVY